MSGDELLALAIHECGHGVAHMVIRDRRAALGLPAESHLKSLTIDPASGTGLCSIKLRKPHDRRDYAVCCLAGFAGETRYLNGPAWWPSPDAFAEHMHLADIRMALDEVAALPDPAAEIWAAWSAAVAVVAAEWLGVERLGYRLRREGAMSGAAFEAAWRRARDG